MSDTIFSPKWRNLNDIHSTYMLQRGSTLSHDILVVMSVILTFLDGLLGFGADFSFKHVRPICYKGFNISRL